MAVRIESHAEPIPGYRLIERLGGGGFGEVWKAEAPGGLLKAIKFVYGDLHCAGDDGIRAEQELKAMRRVQAVRHPYILSLERYDIIEGQLLIVMELADRNLWDRYKECRAQGLPGIPRDELLRYMDETAEALDLMNLEHQLQHLDIKPQNLFLVHNHVKVADFGLVKDLEGRLAASVTGGVTPVYAAPETFEGYVSRFCDQYSLGIVYQELLTGQRPFSGSNVRQLIMQHIQGTPNLESLPPADRAAIARALLKRPEDRHRTCQDFVRALRAPSAGAAPRADASRERKEQVPIGDMEQPAGGAAAGPPSLAAQLAPTAPAPPPDAPSSPPTRWLGAQEDTPPCTPGGSPASRPPPEVRPDGVLMPTVVLGLGGMGLGVLQRLREQLHERYGSRDAVPHLRLLGIDTDAEAIRAATRGTGALPLGLDEVMLARLNRPSYYLRHRDGRLRLDGWFDQKMLYRIPRSQVTTGLRPLGRLAFCDNYQTLARRLSAELEVATDGDALTASTRATGLGLGALKPRIYVVAGLAGGTGSGMFLDMAYLARRLVQQLGHDVPEVIGLFLVPPVDRQPGHTLALGNACAALTELSHFLGGRPFTARYDEREGPVRDAGPPFSRCMVLPLVDEAGKQFVTSEPAARAADHLCRELLSPLGRAADERRPARPATNAATCQAFGTFRFSFPRRALVRLAARRLCSRLVQRWMSKDAKPLRESVKAWVQEQWTAQELGADQFIVRLQDDCARRLGRAPETAFADVLANLAPREVTPVGGRASKIGPAVDLDIENVTAVVSQLEQLVGRPVTDGMTPAPPALAETLRAAGEELVARWGQKLAELVVRLIEEPAFRLAGAEETVRQITSCIEQVLTHHEPLCQELAGRAADAWARIHALQGVLTTQPPGKARFAAAAELLDLLRLYPKWRYQGMVLQQVATGFVSLRGQLSDQLREINFCRVRLGELQRSFENGDEDQPGTPTPPWLRILFPTGCKTLHEAVERLLEGVSEEDLHALDGQMQGMLRRQFTALVHVCLTSANVLKELAPAMEHVAGQLAEGHLGTTDVAELFFGRHADANAARDEISNAFEEAAPDVGNSRLGRQSELCLLAVPPGPAGDRFAALAIEAVPGTALDTVASGDDVVLYREYPHLPLATLEQLGPLGQEAYRQLTSVQHFTPHSRLDVAFV